MSLRASTFIRSKGKPKTYTQKGTCVNFTEYAVIPFSHRRRTSRWLSKLYGPLFRTHYNWLSIVNLNWNNPSPTSVILRSWPNFQTDCNKFFVTLWLIGFVVRKQPSKLKEHSSRNFSQESDLTLIISPSSDVKFMRCSLSIKSDSMTSQWHKLAIWRKPL